jgi:hypothetical protein
MSSKIYLEGNGRFIQDLKTIGRYVGDKAGKVNKFAKKHGVISKTLSTLAPLAGPYQTHMGVASSAAKQLGYGKKKKGKKKGGKKKGGKKKGKKKAIRK